MPKTVSLPPRRHERGGSSTMTVEQAAEARAAAGLSSPYATLLLKGSSPLNGGEKEKGKEKELSASPEAQAERRRSALEKLLTAMVVDEPEHEGEHEPEAEHALAPSETEQDMKCRGSPVPMRARASTSAAVVEQEAEGSSSHSYEEETNDVYLPQLDESLPDPADVPSTPRGMEVPLRARFALEDLILSPRVLGKQPARSEPDEAASAAPELSQHDQRLRNLAELCATAAASQAERDHADLIGEVAKVLRKMYHLAWERDQEEGDGAGAGASKPKDKPDPIQKAQDICQISQAWESRSDQNAHTSGSASTETVALPLPTPRAEIQSKAAAIQQWLDDMQEELGGSSGLPPPAWAAKLGVAATPEEKTLVGDTLELPTKLPADDNPEDAVDRVSLTAELPIRAWIRELLRRTDVSHSQIKVAACYMIALRPHVTIALRKRQEAAFAISRSEPLLHYHASPLTCPRRTLVGALILASKFLGEKVYSMKAWARVTGLEAPDLVQSEQAIGQALKWDLWVGANVHNLRSDVFTRTLFQIVSAPGAQAIGRPYPQELLDNSLPVVPPARAASPEQDVQEEKKVGPAVPDPEEHAVRRGKEVDIPPPLGRKRRATESPEYAISNARAQKRIALEPYRLVPIKPEPVDDQRLLAEAY